MVLYSLAFFIRISASLPSNESRVLVPLSRDKPYLGVDDRFTIAVASTNTPINGLQTYMNIIYYAQKLALQDFREKLKEEDVISLAPWNGVELTFFPEKSTCEVRYIIWGLYQLASFFTEEGFKETLGVLRWNNVDQGRLELKNAAPRALIGSSNTVPDMSANATGLENSYNNTTLGVTTFESYFRDDALPLPIASVYISITESIVVSAQKGRSNRLDTFTVEERKYLMFLTFENTDLYRPRPLFLTGAKAVMTLWQAAQWITAQRNYKDFNTNCLEGGSLIGIARLRKVRPGDQSPGTPATS